MPDSPIAAGRPPPAPVVVEQPFDQHSAGYDDVADSDLGRVLRGRVHQVLTRHLASTSAVLDLGCGTGIDSAWMAGRVAKVTALDPSPGMAAIAHQRCEDMPRVDVKAIDPVTFATSQIDPAFDVVLANFGVANCLAPTDLAIVLGRTLKPGGRFVCVPMPQTCPFERVVGAVTLRPELKNRRRRGPSTVAGYEGLELTYPDHRRLARSLPDMALLSSASLGLVLPTYDYRGWVEGRRGPLRFLNRADVALESIGGRLGWGDHLVTVFERTTT